MENIIAVAVKGIIKHNNKVLIIQRSTYDNLGAGIWEFVGGRLNFGEALETALEREIKEETGLVVEINKLICATTFKANEHKQFVILTYLCTANSDKVVLSDEHQNYLWATQKQMRELLLKQIIDDMNKNYIWQELF